MPTQTREIPTCNREVNQDRPIHRPTRGSIESGRSPAPKNRQAPDGPETVLKYKRTFVSRARPPVSVSAPYVSPNRRVPKITKSVPNTAHDPGPKGFLPARHPRNRRTYLPRRRCTVVELMGRYSKLDIATKLRSLLAGSGNERPPARTTRSVRRLRRLTDVEVDELVQRYRDGCSIHILARDFGIHRTTVSAQLKARGVLAATRRINNAERTEVVRLYEASSSLAQVSERLGMSENSVQRVLKRAGVTTRPVGTNQWSARS